MTARLSLGRAFAVAGLVTAVAVPLAAGSALAGPMSPGSPASAHSVHKPKPTTTSTAMPAATHTAAPTTTPTAGHTSTPHKTHTHKPAKAHGSGHHKHHTKVATLRTRMRDAQIRTSPMAAGHSRAISTLSMPGSAVTVTCRIDGAMANGSKVWFRTVAPARGYISSSAVSRPVHPIGRCK